MTNDDIKALIERLENVRGSFVIPIEAPDVFGWADEAAQALSLLLDVKIKGEKLEPLLRGDPLIDGPQQWQEDINFRQALKAVEDA